MTITARDDTGDPRAGDAEWDAMREARARMLRERIQARALRDPAVEALTYWAPGYPEDPTAHGPAGRA